MIKSALCTEKALCFVVPVLQTSRGVEGAVFCGTGASDQQRCGRRCVSGYQCFRPAEIETELHDGINTQNVTACVRLLTVKVLP